jgi:ornithine decarboxylase
MELYLMLVHPILVFPSKMIKDNSNKIISKKLTAFDFFGPTCDSMDYMKGTIYSSK